MVQCCCLLENCYRKGIGVGTLEDTSLFHLCMPTNGIVRCINFCDTKCKCYTIYKLKFKISNGLNSKRNTDFRQEELGSGGGALSHLMDCIKENFAQYVQKVMDGYFVLCPCRDISGGVQFGCWVLSGASYFIKATQGVRWSVPLLWEAV